MSDVPRDEPSSPRRRLRFSLVSLLLAIGLVGALVANYLNVRELQVTKAELLKLREEVGELTIDDPERVHVIALPQFEGLTFRWRVHLPKGQRFRLRWASGDKIPQKDMPDASQFTHCDELAFDPRPDEPFLVTLRFAPDPERDWNLHWYAPGNSMSSTLLQLSEEWRKNGDRRFDWAGVGQTKSVPEGEPLVLVRVRRPKFSGGGVMSDPDPTDGVMVWIEPY